LFQYQDFGSGGAGAGTATLGLHQALPRQRAARPAFGTKVEALRDSAHDYDLIVDLGVRIGSLRWWRGAVTCVALCAAAWSFAPEVGPMTGSSPAPLTDAQWDEARVLGIAPLALGADTGRRMAPTDAVEPLADTPERPRIELVATLGRGDGFSRLLQRSGVGRAEAERLAALVGEAVPLGEIRPGTAIDIALGRRPNRQVARPVENIAFRARFDLKLAVTRVGGAFALERIPIAVDDTPLRIQGRVGSSLYRSARAAGVPATAVQAYLRAVAGQMDINRLGADDGFDIIVEHRRAATGETETGALLYAGVNRTGGKDLQLMQWTQDGRTQWFEASGVGKSRGTLLRPVPGRVSSNFGMRRHPILGFSRMHKGMDFKAGFGTPILAVADGQVRSAGWHGGYGKQVRLDHGNGLVTSYSHMSRFAISPGARVRQGQVIGYVGSTGLSTGPHLHYELYRNGAAINPASVKFITQAQLAGRDLEAFRSRLRSLLSVRPGAAAAPVQQAEKTEPASIV
jgi:murein DD-endopeptidase MepM/ murein hydrolase activator NlpD